MYWADIGFCPDKIGPGVPVARTPSCSLGFAPKNWRYDTLKHIKKTHTGLYSQLETLFASWASRGSFLFKRIRETFKRRSLKDWWSLWWKASIERMMTVACPFRGFLVSIPWKHFDACDSGVPGLNWIYKSIRYLYNELWILAEFGWGTVDGEDRHFWGMLKIWPLKSASCCIHGLMNPWSHDIWWTFLCWAIIAALAAVRSTWDFITGMIQYNLQTSYLGRVIRSSKNPGWKNGVLDAFCGWRAWLTLFFHWKGSNCRSITEALCQEPSHRAN